MQMETKSKNGSWQNDPPTEKQLQAIANMSIALGAKSWETPKTKKEASEVIGKLKGIIQNNVSLTGLVNPSASSAWDDESEDWLDPIF